MFDLKGKVAVITGGASGMGRATVELFIKAGAQVACLDILDDKQAAMAAQFGENFRYVHTDVTNDEELRSSIDEVAETFGGLHILFNNAGAARALDEDPFDLEGYDKDIKLLQRAVVAGTKFAVPHMIAAGGGSIINTASIAGLQAGYGPFGYSVAKAAVAQMARHFATRLATHKIRVNTICPGFIPTAIFGRAMGETQAQAEQRSAMIAENANRMQPLPLAGRPEDIANMALFFASDASQFITGQTIAVDGGITCGPRSAWDEEAASVLQEVLGMVPED